MTRHTDIEIYDHGERVICDLCSEDWTGRPESGGFLFVSKAYCPKCAESSLATIKKYNEERFIRAHCPQGMPFAKWVVLLRNGNNQVRITTVRDEP